jgi:hypothetical protein
VRWYYFHQFLTLALCGLITPVVGVTVIVMGLGGRTVAELRAHQDRLVHILGQFGLIALSSLAAGVVFTMSAWVLWVEYRSEQVRGRAWPILGCFLTALLCIAFSLHFQLQIFWTLLAIEFTGMLVFWRERGTLWKVRGKGIKKLAKKRGRLLLFVLRRRSTPA